MANHNSGSFESKRGLSVEIRGGNIEAAIRTLGRKVKQEGVLKDLKARQFYEPPSVKRRRKHAEAISRHRKDLAERNQTL